MLSGGRGLRPRGVASPTSEAVACPPPLGGRRAPNRFAGFGGNAIVSKNRSVDPSTLPGSDSTEVMTNTISGNLICHRNTPAAQVNALDGGLPNTVAGRKIGECANL